ncbi:MAG: TonB-dependent receptor [Deltaproteobacteria bacterium]|nr:TonB-dependent receptor [Deltaproteobacteria bacterium]
MSVPRQPALLPGRRSFCSPSRARPHAGALGVALALLGLLPAGLRAQEDDAPVVDEVPETVVRARAPGEAEAKAPTAAHYAVSLRERSEVDADLGAALEGLPPVGLHRYGGGLTTFSLRGSASHQTRVEIGGVPLTPLGGGSVDLSGLDPALFSRAEVIAGPQGAAFGTGALGGVLSLSPWPEARGGPRTELELKTGNHHRASLALRQALGEGGRLALTAGHEGGDFLFERDLTPNLPDDPWITERRVNNARREGSVLLTARRRLAGGKAQLIALGTQRRLELPGPVGFPTPGAGAESRRALLGAFFEGRSRGAGSLRPRVRLHVRQEHLELWPGSTPLPGAAAPQRSELREGGALTEAELLLGAHLLTLGGALEGSQLAGELRAGRVVGALHLRDRVYLLEGRLLLSGAARLDLPGDQPLQPSAALGVTWTLHESLELQANLGRSVRLPTLTELHREGPLTAANPGLVPESAVAGDLGLRLSLFRRRVELGLSGFLSRYADLITYELYPPLKMRATNLRAALVAGVESRLVLAPGGGFSAELSHALTHSRVLGDDPNERGKPLPYRPAQRGHLRLALERGPLTGHLGVEARSQLRRNRAGTKTLPARALLSAGLRGRLGPGCSLALQLDNLLDDRRQEDVHGYPLPGRTLLTSLRCAFGAKGNDR